MKISDVLELAANEFLSHGAEDSDRMSAYSCCAVDYALWSYGRPGYNFEKSVYAFLQSLGCPVWGTHAFPASWTDEQRQGTRYAWLMLAAQVARERGL